MNKEAGTSASVCHSLMLRFVCSKANASAFSFSSQAHYIFFPPGSLLIYDAPSFFLVPLPPFFIFRSLLLLLRLYLFIWRSL